MKTNLKIKKNYRVYMAVTVISSVILGILALRHAIFSVVNVVAYGIFLIYFCKNMKQDAPKKTSIIYITAYSICNIFSLLLAVLVILALIATAGTDTFTEIISTL